LTSSASTGTSLTAWIDARFRWREHPYDATKEGNGDPSTIAARPPQLERVHRATRRSRSMQLSNRRLDMLWRSAVHNEDPPRDGSRRTVDRRLALVDATNALKPLKALVDQCLHQSLIRHSAPGCYILGPTEQVLRNPQGDLGRRLIKRLEYFALELLVIQFVKRVFEWFSGRLGFHLLILRMILLDASRAWMG